jgi:hypothetical protein
MARLSSALARCVVVGGGILFFAGLCASAHGQADLIGSRGGLTTPTVPTTPVLPPTLNLPPDVTSRLLNGLNSSGTALRPGMGWLVSDLSHQGFQGPQLADIIHQLKPYKQRGVLTFPQTVQQPVTSPTTSPIVRPIEQRILPPPWRWSDDDGQGRGMPSFGHGQGHNKGGKGGKGGKGK